MSTCSASQNRVAIADAEVPLQGFDDFRRRVKRDRQPIRFAVVDGGQDSLAAIHRRPAVLLCDGRGSLTGELLGPAKKQLAQFSGEAATIGPAEEVCSAIGTTAHWYKSFFRGDLGEGVAVDQKDLGLAVSVRVKQDHAGVWSEDRARFIALSSLPALDQVSPSGVQQVLDLQRRVGARAEALQGRLSRRRCRGSDRVGRRGASPRRPGRSG